MVNDVQEKKYGGSYVEMFAKHKGAGGLVGKLLVQ